MIPEVHSFFKNKIWLDIYAHYQFRYTAEVKSLYTLDS